MERVKSLLDFFHQMLQGLEVGKTESSRKCFLPCNVTSFVYFSLPFNELQERTVLVRCILID